MSRVLVVDDHAAMGELVSETLTDRGHHVVAVETLADARTQLESAVFDVVLTDLNLGVGTGLDVCEHALASQPDVPVIVFTAYGNMDAAVKALRTGAYDFLQKPIEMDPLALAVERAARHRELTSELRRLRSDVRPPDSRILLGESRAIERVRERVLRVADTNVTLLIEGESGTGKELTARLAHEASERRTRAFVPVNCAAVSPSVLESELFGHKKGAFTGAKDERLGLFRQADGGTIFLDEVGEMPEEMQPKLLRVLQEQKVRPVGSDRAVPFDARVVAATNRDLEDEVEAGRFREDLYYRLNVVRVVVPPLRARRGDILLLAQHFTKELSERFSRNVTGISSDAATLLRGYSWPGNVRELWNAMEHAVAMARFNEIAPADLPDVMQNVTPVAKPAPKETTVLSGTLAEIEERAIRQALDEAEGNKAAAARVLGIDRRTLYRKLERFGDEVEESEEG